MVGMKVDKAVEDGVVAMERRTLAEIGVDILEDMANNLHNERCITMEM